MTYRLDKYRRFKAGNRYESMSKEELDFSRYVNHKAIRNSVSWRDYKKSIRKNNSPIPPNAKALGILGGILWKNLVY